MSGLDSHIDLGERIVAKDADLYASRELTLENIGMTIETPFKTIDGTNVKEGTANLLINKKENTIIEAQKNIFLGKTWARLDYLANEAASDRISGFNSLFNIHAKTWNRRNTAISTYFSRSPFVEKQTKIGGEFKTISGLSIDAYEGVLDYIHGASSSVVLCPDLRYEKTVDYLDYVDKSMKILSDFNSKPLFAPMQINLPSPKTVELLQHYKKNGYKNIWINMCQGQLDSLHSSQIRSLIRNIDKTIGLDQSCIYYSHMKKELNENAIDNRVLGSDVLSQFLAADFVGINSNPMRIIPTSSRIKYDLKIEQQIKDGRYKDKSDYERKFMEHKMRVFDPKSYYYYKISAYPDSFSMNTEDLLDDSVNRMFNSMLLKDEVDKARTAISLTNMVKPYLKTKTGLVDNAGVVNDITGSFVQNTLFDILGRL